MVREEMKIILKEREQTWGASYSQLPDYHSFQRPSKSQPSLDQEIPADVNDLSASIRGLIGGDAGFPIGEWGDEALNAAAMAAAEALISTTEDPEYSRVKTTEY
mgnify:CR=1 FL=1